MRVDAQQSRFAGAPSFRDPAGRVLPFGNRVLRFINASAEADLDAFLASAVAKKLINLGQLVQTHDLDATYVEHLITRTQIGILSSEAYKIIEHDRVAFPSFPYEWSP